jgi:hypothetical protein
VIETLSLEKPRSPTSSIRSVGSDQFVPSQVATEIAETPSAAESIGWPMKYRFPPAS